MDDNPQNVELLQAYLEVLGCKTVVAGDGIEAIQIIDEPQASMPDLILLDVMMPRMSGFEVCRKIKDDPKTRSIPVMMVTALNETGDIERAAECGTDDYISKPIDRKALVEQVNSLLATRARN